MDPVSRRSFDTPVAVIGDVHGRADLLRALLARLPADLPVLVLGDLCDRGPDTRDVLDQLVARGADGVRGNHEEWLLAWARREGFDTAALSPRMGGQATLASYGVEGRTAREVEAQAWRVPAPHLAFLERLAIAMELRVMGERYWLVHAGIPSTESLRGVAFADVVPHLARTVPASLLWAANDPEEMLPVDAPVLMGHMPRDWPLDAGHVIAIDTGAGTTRLGRLTAVLLPSREFVTVG